MSLLQKKETLSIWGTRLQIWTWNKLATYCGSKQLEKITEKINKTDRDIFKPTKFDVNSDKSFCTSTPQKKKITLLLQCEECLNQSQCIDCLIKHYEEERRWWHPLATWQAAPAAKYSCIKRDTLEIVVYYLFVCKSVLYNKKKFKVWVIQYPVWLSHYGTFPNKNIFLPMKI